MRRTTPVFPCPHCHYDLAGSTDRRCSECGERFEVVPTRGHDLQRGIAGPAVGVLLCIGGLGAWFSLPGTGPWIDPGSLSFVSGWLLGGMLVAHGFSGLGLAVRCAAVARTERYGRLAAIRWWREAAALTLIIGIVAALGTAIAALQQLDDPANLGQLIAGGLFAQLYAAIGAGFMSFVSMTIARRGDDGATNVGRGLLVTGLGSACSVASLLAIWQVLV